MCLTGSVVWILAEYHDFDRVEWGRVERGEDAPGRRVDRLAEFQLAAQEFAEHEHFGAFEISADSRAPRGIEFHARALA